METFSQDVKYGARMLLKHRGVTLIAVLTLALGIGANTAIFSVLDGVFLDPFPYPDHGRLVQFRQVRPKAGAGEQTLHAGREILAVRDQAQSFAAVAAIETVSRNITVGGEEPERLFGAKVTPNFFSVLAVPPLLGRALAPEEYGRGAANSIVLGHAFWQRRFAGDAKILGRAVELDGDTYTVIGVMPPRFRFGDTQFWMPFPFDLRDPPLAQRWYQAIGRLKPGVSLQQANSELAGLAQRIEQENLAAQADYAGWRLSALTLRDAFLGTLRPAVFVLTGAVGFVLLIACANVASLLLARALARQSEVAVRAALGASRGRLLRQFLTESALLALAGGGLGLILGAWALDGLLALIPTGNSLAGASIPAEADIRISLSVLWFTAAISCITVLLFGLFPAMQASRASRSALLEATRSGSGGAARRRTRNALVAVEIALALVLLASAGLMLRTFARLAQIDPGFNAENVLTMRFNLPPNKYRNTPERAAFFQQLIEQVQTLPGVESAAVASHPPFWFTERSSLSLEGQPAPEQRQSAQSRTVSAEYFPTLGLTLLSGRNFTPADGAQQEGPVPAIVNQTMVKRFWANTAPVGQRFTFYVGNTPVPAAVVGVVRDHLQSSLEVPTEPEMIFPMSRAAGLYRRMNLLVRTRVEPASLTDAVRRKVWELDKQLPMYSISTMREALDNTLATRRFALRLLAFFSALAVALAVAGIYSVMAYNVSQRTREIGIRVSLGAQRADILRLILREGALLAIAGVAAGVVGALALTRFLERLLFAVSAQDPLTLVFSAVALVAVSLAACVIPARRATRTDPMAALRYE